MPSDSARRSTTRSQAAVDETVEATRMSFGDHLEELRARLILAIAGVVIGTIVCLIFGKKILEIACWPLLVVQHANGLPPHVQVLAPASVFLAYMKIAFLSGLILTMPWVLYQIWRFVMSGLYPHERRFLKSLIPASLVLFVIGVLFLYFMVLPMVLHFFIGFNQAFDMPDLTPTAFQRLLLPERQPEATPVEGITGSRVPVLSRDPTNPKSGDTWINTTTQRLVVQTGTGPLSIPLESGASATTMQSQFALDSYISFVLALALAFGIAFETPIVVYFLVLSGIVSRATMVRSRRYILLGIVIVAAVITPPDVVSQLLLAVPMYVLFEIGLFAARGAGEKSPTDAEA